MEASIKTTNSGVERGILDTWPVRSRGEKVAAAPKPVLLQNLEAHLNKELRLLGCPPVGPSEIRLQAHKEVFDCLIEKFTTYKPLLSAIKNEYDLFIIYQTELIRELLPLKTQIQTLKDGYEQKIISLRENDKFQDEKVRQENHKLRIEIKKLKTEESSYQKQIKLLQEELGTIYEKYRFEADARKLLIAERSEKEEDHSEQNDTKKEDAKDDPVILKLNLGKVREDLHEAKKRINEILADYGDVVPRNEFEATEQLKNDALSELDNVKSQYSLLMKEHSTLVSMYKDLEERKKKALEELEHLKGSATPRPDWDRCGEFIDGGAEKWKEISNGCTSDEMVDILLAKIAGVEVSEINRHEVFHGQGTESHVPRYLQCEGEITNRRIKPKELNELINGFWEYWLTINSDKEKGEIDNVLHQYLLTRNNGVETKAIEDGYNIHDACGRYRHIIHVCIFGAIMNGNMSESVYIDWISLQVKLTELLKEECLTDENEVSIEQLEQVLKREFPLKSSSMIQSLIECAQNIAYTPNRNINVLQLMMKGQDNEPNSFVLLLLEQTHDQLKVFNNELKKVIGDKSEVNYTEAIETIQSYISSNKSKVNNIEQLLSEMYSLPNDSVSCIKLSAFICTRLK